MGMYVSNYLKYVNGIDITRVAYNQLTYPSQNCLLYKGKVYSRPGITNDGTAPTPNVLKGIIGEKVWKDTPAGVQIASRVTGQKWQVKQKALTGGKWITIFNGFSPTMVRARFDTWYDQSGNFKKKRMYGVDGSENVYEWNGGMAKIASVTGTVLTFSGEKTLAQLGFDDGSTDPQSITIFRYSGGVLVGQEDYQYNTAVDQEYIASTIAFVSAGNQITDSANGFLSAGIQVGQQLTISGSASNNGMYIVTAVSAGSMNVMEAIVDEGAGASVSIDVPISAMNLTATPSPAINVGDIVVATPTVNTGILTGFLKDEVYTYNNQLGLASLSSQTVWFSNGQDASDFVVPLSGTTADSAYQFILTANFTAMLSRRGTLWVSTADDWLNVTHSLTALSDGTFNTITPFEQPERNGALPFAITSFSEDAIFMSQDHRLQQITTIAVTNKDAFLLLSDDIDFLLLNTDLTECRLYFQLRYVFIACPAANLLLMLDTVGYPEQGISMFWQPPQVMPISLFSVIEGVYTGHSSVQDESYLLLSGGDDLGADISVTMAFGYIGGEFRKRYINIQDRHQLYMHTRIGVDGRINPQTIVTGQQYFETDGIKNYQESVIDGSKIKTFDLPEDYAWAGLPWTSASWTGEPPVDTNNTGDPNLKRFYVFDKNTVTSWFEHRMVFVLQGKNMSFHLLGFSMDISRSDRKIDAALWLTK